MGFIESIFTGLITNVLSELFLGSKKKISKKEVDYRIREVLKSEYNLSDTKEISLILKDINQKLYRLESLKVDTDSIEIRQRNNNSEFIQELRTLEEQRQRRESKQISDTRLSEEKFNQELRALEEQRQRRDTRLGEEKFNQELRTLEERKK